MNKKCPHCGKIFSAGDIAERNMSAYETMVTVRASCCGKHVLCSPVFDYTVHKSTRSPKDKDDWGQ